MTHKLYFVRHGETDWNAEGRLQGQRDIPLNDVGRVQAEEVGAILARLAPDHADLAYWSSPLSRTRETMELLRARIGLHPPAYRMDDRLKELSFGAWEGLTWPEVEAHSPSLAAARLADKWHTKPPEGENYEDVAARLAAFLALVDRPAVIVSHGGVGRTLMALRGTMDRTRAAEVFVRQGVVYVFDGDRFTVEG
ncbi:histidine phosphatase family protein [Phreatobacter oligotrophus]|jgi:broad specificity phosphatase PhoE|uniref:histidine phosphatase family protein n=1 Tax=Phreatobacter oligotrophus TaxID=1122261 RepID=UPI002352BE8D|nr:histidine phosphatase family protein [Phreatobacter oligotrophus]MBX9991922.1 histidine phosphatase family protein [Phreatobacter oligotrophus]